MKSILILVLLIIILSGFTQLEYEKSISNFKLKNATTTKFVSLSNYKNAKGFAIVFICNKCPMAKFYSKRFNELNLKYKKLGIPLLAINSMDTLAYEEESFALMQKKKRTI